MKAQFKCVFSPCFLAAVLVQQLPFPATNSPNSHLGVSARNTGIKNDHQQQSSTTTQHLNTALAMDDFDLLSEPSTAQAILGARPRTSRPEESDFDPNVPRRTAAQSGPSGSSGTVDLAELKRRIHGPGNWPRLAAWMAWAQDFAKERPRVAFGIFVPWRCSSEKLGVWGGDMESGGLKKRWMILHVQRGEDW